MSAESAVCMTTERNGGLSKLSHARGSCYSAVSRRTALCVARSWKGQRRGHCNTWRKVNDSTQPSSTIGGKCRYGDGATGATATAAGDTGADAANKSAATLATDADPTETASTGCDAIADAGSADAGDETCLVQTSRGIGADAACTHAGASLPWAESPVDTDHCQSPKLMSALSQVLVQFSLQQSPTGEISYFHSLWPPQVSMSDYLSRLHQLFFCSDSCYLIALMYIDRLMNRYPRIQLCNLSCHRLFFIALLVSVKYHEDQFYTNSYYAKSGGLHLPEVNKLEMYFLKLLDWNLTVKPEDYRSYYDLLTMAIQK